MELEDYGIRILGTDEAGHLLMELPADRWKIEGNMLRILPAIVWTSEEEMLGISLKGSKIIYCVVKNFDDVVTLKSNYRGILFDIWSTMEPNDIYDNSKDFCKIIIGSNKDKGFSEIPNKHLSYQGQESTKIFWLILEMISVTKYAMEISIELADKSVVNFRK